MADERADRDRPADVERQPEVPPPGPERIDDEDAMEYEGRYDDVPKGYKPLIVDMDDDEQ